MSTVIAMSKRIIPAIATRGRIIAMLLVGVVGIAVGMFIRRAEADFEPEELLLQFLSQFGFVIFVPLVSLVISTAALGTLIEDKTLVYFWLRPIGRWKIALAALLAGLFVLLPLVLVPMLGLSLVAGSSSTTGALVGALVGVVAYTSVFTMLGLFTQRALAWGLGYILVWEGIIASFSETTGRLSIRNYSTGAMQHLVDLDVQLVENPASMATILIVVASIAAVCFAVTTVRLNTMTVE